MFHNTSHKAKFINFAGVVLAVIIAVVLATTFIKQDETTGDFKLKVPFKK